jgi:hypothetical protein
MPIQINAYGNCESDLLGSATRSCDISSFGDPLGFPLFKKGFNILLNVANFSTAWTDGIKAMDILPYLGIYDFTQDTPENERATSSTGIMSIIRSGKPQFSFSFNQGGCLHKSLYDKRGNGRWDFGIFFETGVLMALSADGLSIQGFDMSMFDVATWRIQQGTDPQTSTATVQLSNAAQFNTRFVFLTYEALGLDLSSTAGVIETNVDFVTLPVALGTTFTARVTSACNSDDVIPGLDLITNWRIAGTQATPKLAPSAVVYNTATGNYEFTVASAFADGDTVQLILRDGAVDVAVDADDVLYKGKTELITI